MRESKAWCKVQTEASKSIQLIAAADGAICASKQKKRKRACKSCGILIEAAGNDGNEKKLKGLLGTGCTKLLALKHCAEKERLKALPWEEAAKHEIHGQTFESREAAAVDFKMLDFSSTKEATWDFQVSMASKPKMMPHGMIAGTGPMSEMGPVMGFGERTAA